MNILVYERRVFKMEEWRIAGILMKIGNQMRLVGVIKLRDGFHVARTITVFYRSAIIMKRSNRRHFESELDASRYFAAKNTVHGLRKCEWRHQIILPERRKC